MFQNSDGNRLLAALSAEDRRMFDPCLEPVKLASNEVLAEPNTPAPFAYFLETGLAATILSDEVRRTVEVGLVGCEGFVGLPIILDAQYCSRRTVMLMGGRAQRIHARALSTLAETTPGIRSRLLNYVHTFIIQTSSTILSQATATLDQRLARWLLMAQDRVGDELTVTHEFLAAMLGVRRPGVTTSLHVLEGEQVVRAMRSRIVILERAALQTRAGASYGMAEREYARVFGTSLAFAEGSVSDARL